MSEVALKLLEQRKVRKNTHVDDNDILMIACNKGMTEVALKLLEQKRVQENAHAGESKPKTKIRIVRDEKNKVPAVVPDVFFEVTLCLNFPVGNELNPKTISNYINIYSIYNDALLSRTKFWFLKSTKKKSCLNPKILSSNNQRLSQSLLRKRKLQNI